LPLNSEPLKLVSGTLLACAGPSDSCVSGLEIFMSQVPLDALPLWGIFVLCSAILGAAIELGYRTGRSHHVRYPDDRDPTAGGVVASILGLVALVLGFTFSFAAARFEARRQSMLEEANAIGTTYLRARLLPDPQRQAIAALLREYVAVRIRSVEPGQLESSVARSEQIHEALWRETEKGVRAEPDSIIQGVFVQSLNSLIDLHATRMMVALRSRIPIVIWAGLILLATLGMAFVGYSAGLSTTRRSPILFGLVFCFSVVILLIADLDRGQEGWLRVSQQALIDTQRSMQETTP
jgi:hypothetical protein